MYTMKRSLVSLMTGLQYRKIAIIVLAAVTVDVGDAHQHDNGYQGFQYQLHGSVASRIVDFAGNSLNKQQNWQNYRRPYSRSSDGQFGIGPPGVLLDRPLDRPPPPPPLPAIDHFAQHRHNGLMSSDWVPITAPFSRGHQQQQLNADVVTRPSADDREHDYRRMREPNVITFVTLPPPLPINASDDADIEQRLNHNSVGNGSGVDGKNEHSLVFEAGVDASQEPNDHGRNAIGVGKNEHPQFLGADDGTNAIDKTISDGARGAESGVVDNVERRPTDGAEYVDENGYFGTDAEEERRTATRENADCDFSDTPEPKHDSAANDGAEIEHGQEDDRPSGDEENAQTRRTLTATDDDDDDEDERRDDEDGRHDNEVGRRDGAFGTRIRDGVTSAVRRHPTVRPAADENRPTQQRKAQRQSIRQATRRPPVTDVEVQDEVRADRSRNGSLNAQKVDEDDESGHQRFSTKTGDPNRSTRTVAATDATERDPERGYGYGYAVRDEHAGTDFSQWERREPGGTGTVTGQYRVQLPDGRTQTVTYTADPDTGYRASVTYQGVPRYPDSKPRSSAPARRSARKTIKSVAPAPNLPHDN